MKKFISLLKEDDYIKRKLQLLFLPLALIFAGVFVSLMISGDYEKTTAVITEISSYYDYGSSENTEHFDVYVDYEINGVKYEHVLLNTYDASMKEGKTIDIEYDINDHTKLRLTYEAYIPIILFISAGCVIFYSLYCVIKHLKGTDL